MSLKIVIPSHRRPNNAKYLDFVPESRRQDVFIVVRAGEMEQLYQHHKDNGVNVIAFDGLTGIHDKRDRIARHFAGEKIWMADDDITLKSTHVKGGYVKLDKENMTEQSFFDFCEYSEKLLDTYPHGMVRHTVFPIPEEEKDFIINKWVWSNAFLNLKVLKADDLEFTWQDHTEDGVAFLKVLEMGYDSFGLAKWCISVPKAGLEGGMTDVRTVEMIERVSLAIHERWPTLTTLIDAKYAFPGHDRPPRTLKMNLRGLKAFRENQKINATTNELDI